MRKKMNEKRLDHIGEGRKKDGSGILRGTGQTCFYWRIPCSGTDERTESYGNVGCDRGRAMSPESRCR